MKRPMHKLRPVRRYQGGGHVDTSIPAITPVTGGQIYQPSSSGSGGMGSVLSTAKDALGLYKAYQDLNKGGQGSKTSPGDVSGGTGSPTAGGGSRKGGTIKKTYGPKIGKEDGIIAAQKGEYVIRKSAVKKLGTRTLAEVNRGRLPEKRMKK